ncbi:MAG TPA: DUF2007 domain-containing protein [Usitatibacter sp.]|nr:DUF2007 domain-containing protein [Usitatibacter sp.]
MKRVYTAANLPEAHLLLDRLAEHGIRARVFNANASSLAGELPIDASLPQLWVDVDSHAQRAREVIDAYLRAGTGGPPRTCIACGEENPPAFDLCWNCGANL